jgi:type IV secretory pathway TrbD component
MCTKAAKNEAVASLDFQTGLTKPHQRAADCCCGVLCVVVCCGVLLWLVVVVCCCGVLLWCVVS